MRTFATTTIDACFADKADLGKDAQIRYQVRKHVMLQGKLGWGINAVESRTLVPSAYLLDQQLVSNISR